LREGETRFVIAARDADISAEGRCRADLEFMAIRETGADICRRRLRSKFLERRGRFSRLPPHSPSHTINRLGEASAQYQ
jgi:hypothetical protein